MFVRLAAAALILLALTPAIAAADERDNAHALAAVGIRATGQLSAILARQHAMTAPKCTTTARLIRRGTQRQIDTADTLFEAHWIARFARATGPVVTAAAADMAAVPTTDPVLRSGRAAWRRVAGAYARFGSLAPVHYCSVLREYVRGDFRRTREIRAAIRMYHRASAWDTTDIDAALSAAVKRLVELGVPAADADAFDGELS
jgi:hypothetical protein